MNIWSYLERIGIDAQASAKRDSLEVNRAVFSGEHTV